MGSGEQGTGIRAVERIPFPDSLRSLQTTPSPWQDLVLSLPGQAIPDPDINDTTIPASFPCRSAPGGEVSSFAVMKVNPATVLIYPG